MHHLHPGIHRRVTVKERRRWFTPAQVNAMWAQWQAGDTLEAISAGLALSPSGMFRVVRAAGGVRPEPATRSKRTLSRTEREVIERGVEAKDSCRAMARMLGRAPSTISREIARNGARGMPTPYQALPADRRAWRLAQRPKPSRLAERPRLRALVAAKLKLEWAPAQIAAWLRATYPEDPLMRVSAETIYQSLYVQARGALRRELTAHLRRGQSMRRSRGARQRTTGGGGIVDAISISARPPEVADRAVPGHWEGDLLAGANASHIATLVERASRHLLLVKVPSKDSTLVARALARRIKRLPAILKASLTWDRGSELSQHVAFTLATDVAVYFCDPRSPWQRGSNENTNGLLRQYFPKGMDLGPITQRQLDAVAHRLNNRPRQTLGWQTPAQRLAQYVASTG
jgi:IS30 family transposase